MLYTLSHTELNNTVKTEYGVREQAPTLKEVTSRALEIFLVYNMLGGICFQSASGKKHENP